MEDSGRRVFISYSHDDAAFADAFAGVLNTFGLNVWKDDRDVLVGDAILQRVFDGIRGASHFCCVISTSSMASEWVERELTFARERQRIDPRLRIVPVKIDGVAIPDHFKAYLVANLAGRNLSIKNPEFVKVLKAFGTDLTRHHMQILIGPGRRQMLAACADVQACLVPFRELLGNYLRAEEAIRSAWANRGYDEPREVGGRVRATTHGSDYLIGQAEKTAEAILGNLRHFARDLRRALHKFRDVWSHVDPNHDIESLRRLLSNDLTLATYMSETIAGSADRSKSSWWVRDKLGPWLAGLTQIESAVEGAAVLLRAWAAFEPKSS